MIELDLVASPT